MGCAAIFSPHCTMLIVFSYWFWYRRAEFSFLKKACPTWHRMESGDCAKISKIMWNTSVHSHDEVMVLMKVRPRRFQFVPSLWYANKMQPTKFPKLLPVYQELYILLQTQWESIGWLRQMKAYPQAGISERALHWCNADF